jgi:putative DNA primase/helicase
MINVDLQQRVAEAKRRAHGSWPGILERLGVDAKVLAKRNQPCPKCGGRDRFQFTDKFGDGNYICRGCGPGDGLGLLELCLGWTFVEALHAVEGLLGCAREQRSCVRGESSPLSMRKLAERIWAEAAPVATGDEVATYLARRGIVLSEYPKVLRTHGALGYFVKEPGSKRAKLVRNYPAMLAAVQGPGGQVVTLHRTYLEHGAKAPIAECKKLLSGGISGAAARLFEPTSELCIAEGIETALAVHLRTGKPVWAALSATNLAKLWIPARVKRVAIYADHDAGYAGQSAAYALAKRLKAEERNAGSRDVAVHVPRQADTDWADVLLERSRRAA